LGFDNKNNNEITIKSDKSIFLTKFNQCFYWCS